VIDILAVPLAAARVWLRRGHRRSHTSSL
jgi:hypothetical protein